MAVPGVPYAKNLRGERCQDWDAVDHQEGLLHGLSSQDSKGSPFCAYSSSHSEHYKTADSWSTEKKGTGKLNLKARRMSYLDHIEIDDKKKRSIPGVGQYKLEPSDKEIAAKKKVMSQKSEKRTDG